MKGVPILSEITVSDLDVIVSKDLTYHKRINKIVAKYHQCLFITEKCFNYNNAEIIKQIYTSYVGPLLEYGVILWSPHSQHEIKIKIVNLVHNNSILSDLPSLERRHNNQALLLFYNLLLNKSHLDSNKFLINHREHHRGHSLLLCKPVIWTSAFHIYFCTRHIDAWNSLPESTILANSSSSFYISLLNLNS